jgi:2-polyprenyl-6-methoxyphenol hydroxylase-like FAD-dependent oxidoreductase
MAQKVQPEEIAPGRRAVVVGGSLAGMLAARVLAGHFQQVTIVERDRYPESPSPRPGIPQAHHLHVLLMRGEQILDQLFPGLPEELAAAGAPMMDPARELAWITRAGWGVRFPSPLKMVSFSRGLLDWLLRRRVEQIAGVSFLPETEVTGLHFERERVCGVKVRPRGERPLAMVENGHLAADLVVDASGRNSKILSWMAEGGYLPPDETVVNAFVGYASRIYARPAGFQADWKGIYQQTAPPDCPRGGVLLPIEGDRWMVGAVGGDRQYPPTDEAGFLEFIESLPGGVISGALRGAVPLTPVSGYRSTENRFRRWEKLAHLPERLLILGDAACAFNPVYGQGMTIAALGALALEDSLLENTGRSPGTDLDGLSRRFQHRLARVCTLPWMLATGEDYRYTQTEGGRPDTLTRGMHRYMNQIYALARTDRQVCRVLIEVFHMLKPPSRLFQPWIMARVLKLAAKR